MNAAIPNVQKSLLTTKPADLKIPLFFQDEPKILCEHGRPPTKLTASSSNFPSETRLGAKRGARIEPSVQPADNEINRRQLKQGLVWRSLHQSPFHPYLLLPLLGTPLLHD